MTRPLALIKWFRTQLSVARALLCASTLNHCLVFAISKIFLLTVKLLDSTAKILAKLLDGTAKILARLLAKFCKASSNFFSDKQGNDLGV